jgi:hypothetical protein
MRTVAAGVAPWVLHTRLETQKVDESGCCWCVGSGGAVGGCGRSGYVVAGCENGLRGRGGAEVAHAGDGTDQLVDLRRPAESLRFVCAPIGCARRCCWPVISYLLFNPFVVSSLFSLGASFILLSRLLHLILPLLSILSPLLF